MMFGYDFILTPKVFATQPNSQAHLNVYAHPLTFFFLHDSFHIHILIILYKENFPHLRNFLKDVYDLREKTLYPQKRDLIEKGMFLIIHEFLPDWFMYKENFSLSPHILNKSTYVMSQMWEGTFCGIRVEENFLRLFQTHFKLEDWQKSFEEGLNEFAIILRCLEAATTAQHKSGEGVKGQQYEEKFFNYSFSFTTTPLYYQEFLENKKAIHEKEKFNFLSFQLENFNHIYIQFTFPNNSHAFQADLIGSKKQYSDYKTFWNFKNVRPLDLATPPLPFNITTLFQENTYAESDIYPYRLSSYYLLLKDYAFKHKLWPPTAFPNTQQFAQAMSHLMNKTKEAIEESEFQELIEKEGLEAFTPLI